uniref:Uncharacterized protein n=1 Tax=Cacopsylla melanoneura TaxID=428564 RepID=A0A8D8TR37_9HEMI
MASCFMIENSKNVVSWCLDLETKNSSQFTDSCHISPTDICHISLTDRCHILLTDSCHISLTDSCHISLKDSCNISLTESCHISPMSHFLLSWSENQSSPLTIHGQLSSRSFSSLFPLSLITISYCISFSLVYFSTPFLSLSLSDPLHYLHSLVLELSLICAFNLDILSLLFSNV